MVDRMWLGSCWIRTNDGPRNIGVPFDNVKLSEHVMQSNTYGLAMIAPGESTTRVAVLDFDSHKGDTPWLDMSRIVMQIDRVLQAGGFTPTLFRSGGGKGVHLILLWDEPQDAYSVRKMLADTLELFDLRNGAGGVSRGQVEIFPKADSVPEDGFGNMTYIPLARSSRWLLPHNGALADTALNTPPQWAMASPVPLLEKPPRAEHDGDISIEHATLRSALAAIPNEGNDELDYDGWRDVLFGVHHATGGDDDGLALAHEFSARSSKYDPDFLDNRVWPYIRSDRDTVITARSIVARASDAGWQDPTLEDDYEVVPLRGPSLQIGMAGELLRSSEPAVVVQREDAHVTGSAAPARFTFKQAAQFASGPPPRWLIKGVLPHAQLGVLYGESTSGKSFFALDIAGAISRGFAWRDHKTNKARVAYIVAEGAAGFRNRIAAYCAHHQIDAADLDLYILGDAPNFLKAEQILELITSLKAISPALVIVDTLAQAMPGADENGSEDMGKAISHCKSIHQHTGAMVLLVHHAGKDASRGARGWSGLKAAADVEIEIVRNDAERVATVTKLKDGDDGLEFGFSLGTVILDMDEDEDEITSCFVQAAEVMRREAGKSARPKGAVALLVLRVAHEMATPGQTGVRVGDLLTRAAEQLTQDPLAKSDRRRDRVRSALDTCCAGNFLRVEGDVVLLPGSDDDELA